MEIQEFLENNKNKVLNFGVIIFALFIALQIYNYSEKKEKSLILKKTDELKKNKVRAEIASFEDRLEGYKKILVKRDLGFVMDTISVMAKDCSVKIVSIKPSVEEEAKDYARSPFLITVKAPSYHALGKFVSLIENNKDIFIIDEISIISNTDNRSLEDVDENLNVNLKLSTISYK